VKSVDRERQKSNKTATAAPAMSLMSSQQYLTYADFGMQCNILTARASQTASGGNKVVVAHVWANFSR
jgi:hypothetical protein